MTAAVYTGDRTIALAASNPGPLAEDEVGIDVSYTGICGTDLHILHGAMDSRVGPRAVLGHEMSGTIAAVGAGVREYAAGDRVTVMPTRSCGSCPACRDGHAHVCHKLDFLGIDSPGAMQRRWNVPAELLVRLPEQLPLEHGALVEPTAVAVHDVQRSGVCAGDAAVVIGAGPIGILIALVARSRGAEVTVVETSPTRRALAQAYDLDVIDPASIEVTEFVLQRTEGRGADVAFEVSGAEAGLATAVDVLKVRGRCVLVAIHPLPTPVNLHRFFWRELELVGARLYGREDFAAAVELLASGAIDVEPLISAVRPLSAAAEAFELLESGSAMKVLIDCREDGR